MTTTTPVEDALAICDGCENLSALSAGEVEPRFELGTPSAVHYCADCWEIVDCCDEDGSFGAGCCEVKRVVHVAA